MPPIRFISEKERSKYWTKDQYAIPEDTDRLEQMNKDRSYVAVVDDEISVRKALQRLLNSDGRTVESYPSGEAFLESLATRRPDCVVLDLHLSGMTGFDVLSRMKETGVSIPAIIITGRDSPETRKQAMDAGVADYLRKPFNDEIFLTAVTRAMYQE